MLSSNGRGGDISSRIDMGSVSKNQLIDLDDLDINITLANDLCRWQGKGLIDIDNYTL
jgi:hypothetical protein